MIDTRFLAPIPTSARAQRVRAIDWLIGAVFTALVAVAFTVAAFAATIVGLLAALAALLLRLAPTRQRAAMDGGQVADGWVVNAGPRR